MNQEIRLFLQQAKSIRKPRLRLACHIAFDLSLLFMFIYLTQLQHEFYLLASSIIYSILLFRSFGIMHDAVHRAAHPNKTINHLVGIVFGTICALPYWPWKKLHIEHHKWSGNVEKDPVMNLVKNYPNFSTKKKSFLNFTWRSWIPYMAFLQHTVFWLESWKRISFFENAKDSLYNLSSFFVAALYYGAIIQLTPISTIACMFGGFLIYLVWVEIINFPHHLSLPQHKGELKFSFTDQYKFARSCHYPKWFSRHFLNNFNYHVEHHMFPHLPWYELAELSPLIHKSLGEKYNYSKKNKWIVENKKQDLGYVLSYTEKTSEIRRAA